MLAMALHNLMQPTIGSPHLVRKPANSSTAITKRAGTRHETPALRSRFHPGYGPGYRCRDRPIPRDAIRGTIGDVPESYLDAAGGRVDIAAFPVPTG